MTFRDERRPEKPVVATILGPSARQFISPNDLHVQYYSWICVDNCIQPEFHWRRIMTLADALDKTDCKERGVQSLSFNCTFNLANGSQIILILRDISFSGHKKADLEIETVMCVEHCELLNPPPNP